MPGADDGAQEHFARHLEALDWSGSTVAEHTYDACEFKRCDFSATTFANCKFIDCQFVECNLSLARFPRSHIREVTFADSKIVGVNWTLIDWPRLILAPPLAFRKCVLDDGSFFGLVLEDIVIEECKAREVDFREANLRGANLTYTDFARSLFGKTNLTGADLTEAVNYDINIFDNEIKHAKFSRCEAIRLLNSLDIELND